MPGDDVDATRLRMAQELRSLAEQGVAKKQYYLGRYYEAGLDGFPQNYAEAEKWYRKAAEQGYADAQCQLGDMYFRGQRVLKNAAEAWEWYLLAAEQGSEYSQSQLAYMCALGAGRDQSYAAAVYWYRRSAARILPPPSLNSETVVNWHLCAANEGDAEAQYWLGVMYANGECVRQDYVYSHMWFNLSGAQGHQGALKNREMVAAKMTPAQIAEAQKLGREWKPTKQQAR